VGQTDRHWPQVVQMDSDKGLSMKVPMRELRPAPKKSMAPMNWWPSWQACAQRPQRMQDSMAMLKTVLLPSVASRWRVSQRGNWMLWCWAAVESWAKSPLPSFTKGGSLMPPGASLKLVR